MNDDNTKYTTIDIDVIYSDEKQQHMQGKNEMVLYKKSLSLLVENDKVKDSFIGKALSEKKEGNYLKIELHSKQNTITINTILECIEYIVDPDYEIIYTRDNMISFFYAFSICQLEKKKTEVLDKLMSDLSDENIISLLQVIPSLKDEKLNHYAYTLIKYLINYNNNLPLEFKYYNRYFKDLIQLSPHSKITFDFKRLYYSNKTKNIQPNVFYANLSFLQKTHNTIKEARKKYSDVNNYFNMGVIYRKKSEFGIMHDYPHYYQMKLENDTSININAMRESENSNFIFSSDINDFSKFGMNYLGEIESSFWGTQFVIYDNGLTKQLFENTPSSLCDERKCLGKINYQTNIMGECPRLFAIDAYSEGTVYKLENVKPEWSEKMMCHCLNFYGRVKKASAKNFQIIIPGEEENILLLHGKNKKNEFSIDFRDPFSPLLAFATSLAAIGKKRVVS